MKKRFTTIMALVIALAMSMTVIAGAITVNDTDCAIKVTAKINNRPVSGIEIAIFKVGDPRIDNNNLYYDVADVIANANPEKVIDLNGMNEEVNRDNTEEISLRIRNILNGNEKDQAYIDLMDIKSEVVKTDENGEAVFSGLTPGVYFVRQDSIDWTFETITPMLIPVPMTVTDENGSEWDKEIEVFPKLQYRPDDEEPTTKPTTGTTGSTEPTEDIPDDDVPSGSTDDEDIDDPDVPKQELPETGMMQWPVPFMAMGGVVLFGMGYISEKKSKN